MQHFTPEEIAEHRRIVDARNAHPTHNADRAKHFGIKSSEHKSVKEHELPYWETRDHS